VGLAYLVLHFPQVRRLSWALAAAGIVFAVLAAVLARSRGARALMVRWAAPLIAFVVGWACVAAVMTWSFEASGTGWFILVLLVVIDVLLVVPLAYIAVARDWKVGVTGLLVIGLMWIPVFFGPSEPTVRRLRVELAAPSLVKDAQRVLDDPSKAKDAGPFIAYDDNGGRVVGWLIGPGFLGEGPGLVWDPEGVLQPRGLVGTREPHYPWVVSGDTCEPIVDDWLYCALE
jgi:hypothetical protein